jgi:hypothetical protein
VTVRDADVTLADELERVLATEPAGLPLVELARRVRRRRVAVLAVLRGERRFRRDGRTRGSRWPLDPEAHNGVGWERMGTNLGLARDGPPKTLPPMLAGALAELYVAWLCEGELDEDGAA